MENARCLRSKLVCSRSELLNAECRIGRGCCKALPMWGTWAAASVTNSPRWGTWAVASITNSPRWGHGLLPKHHLFDEDGLLQSNRVANEFCYAKHRQPLQNALFIPTTNATPTIHPTDIASNSPLNPIPYILSPKSYILFPKS